MTRTKRIETFVRGNLVVKEITVSDKYPVIDRARPLKAPLFNGFPLLDVPSGVLRDSDRGKADEGRAGRKVRHRSHAKRDLDASLRIANILREERRK